MNIHTGLPVPLLLFSPGWFPSTITLSVCTLSFAFPIHHPLAVKPVSVTVHRHYAWVSVAITEVSLPFTVAVPLTISSFAVTILGRVRILRIAWARSRQRRAWTRFSGSCITSLRLDIAKSRRGRTWRDCHTLTGGIQLTAQSAELLLVTLLHLLVSCLEFIDMGFDHRKFVYLGGDYH